MNFSYNEDQQSIQDVAVRMFRDLCGDDTIRTLYQAEQPLHRELWQQVAQSGLLGTALPAAVGGSDMGMTELCLLLEQQGKSVAPIPVLESIVEAALPIARFGSQDLQQTLLPGVISGETILSAVRPYQGLQAHTPLTATAQPASQANGGEEHWVLNGYSNLVGYAHFAQGFLVTATLADGGYWVGYVDAGSAGLHITSQRATNGEASGHIRFDQVTVPAHNLMATHSEAETLLQWQRQHTFAAMAALQLGVLHEGLRRAAEYTTERTQFGKPLAAFQAVSQQAADGYMAIEALRGVYWRLLDILDQGAADDLETNLTAHSVKYWVCESGHIAAHIFLHLHGGIGQDLDYPVHRFFSWAKKNETYLGGADQQAAQLGRLIQSNPAALV
ncbi:MAG: acyl-CoA dehydrogenase family protein [Pseudomonadota bacterium]|nr:acyl-CoA dehydrogenase family protein [Pseudomonadota bacterium]